MSYMKRYIEQQWTVNQCFTHFRRFYISDIIFILEIKTLVPLWRIYGRGWDYKEQSKGIEITQQTALRLLTQTLVERDVTGLKSYLGGQAWQENLVVDSKLEKRYNLPALQSVCQEIMHLYKFHSVFSQGSYLTNYGGLL